MAKKIVDIDVLSDYLRGVVSRANHHAQNVNSVALVIAGAIIWAKDSEPIEVLAIDGEMKNVLWVKINGRRFAFSYDHEFETIEMRENSTRGDPLFSFSDSDSLVTIHRAFTSVM